MITIKTQKFEDNTFNVVRMNEFLIYANDDGEGRFEVRICHPTLTSEEEYFSLADYCSIERCGDVIEEIYQCMMESDNYFFIMPED